MLYWQQILIVQAGKLQFFEELADTLSGNQYDIFFQNLITYTEHPYAGQFVVELRRDLLVCTG
jgi:hypothetical protein